MVGTPDELSGLCRKIRGAGRFAFDTEFIRERSYQPQLCLVQVAVPRQPVSADKATGQADPTVDPEVPPPTDPVATGPIEFALIDPLSESLSGEGLGMFWSLVNDPAIETVVHAGRQDLEIAQLASDRSAANVLDVQIAAGLIGGGYPLSYAKLVESYLGVALEQTETISDWSARPLSAGQLVYAVEDVAHLLTLRDRLVKRLDELGRRAWLMEESAHQLQTAGSPGEGTPTQPWQRVRGKGSLRGQGLAVLAELAAWREAAARRRDVPARSFLRDDVLVELARQSPTEASDLHNARLLPRGDAQTWATEIVEAVRLGLACPTDRLPHLPPEATDHPEAKILADFAAALGQALCRQHRVSHDLFASRADYLELANHYLRSVPNGSADQAPQARLLTGWRGVFAGEAFDDLLRGRTSLGVRRAGGRLSLTSHPLSRSAQASPAVPPPETDLAGDDAPPHS